MLPSWILTSHIHREILRAHHAEVTLALLIGYSICCLGFLHSYHSRISLADCGMGFNILLPICAGFVAGGGTGRSSCCTQLYNGWLELLSATHCYEPSGVCGKQQYIALGTYYSLEVHAIPVSQKCTIFSICSCHSPLDIFPGSQPGSAKWNGGLEMLPVVKAHVRALILVAPSAVLSL